MLSFLVISAVVGLWAKMISAGIQKAAAEKARDATNAAIDQVVTAQKDSVTDAYNENVTRIQEQAVQVRGTQTQVLGGVMGQAGGEGTAAAGIIEETTRQESRDLNLLDQNLANAMADIDAEANMARTRNENDYNLNMANITADFITSAANIAIKTAGGIMGLPGDPLGTAKSDTATIISGPDLGAGGGSGPLLFMS